MIAIDNVIGLACPAITGSHAAFDANRIGPVEPMTPRLGGLDGRVALTQPGDVFRHPRDVLRHPGLTVADRRAILATWASDAHAVESCPGLRCLDGSRAEPVPVDAVLDALRLLDAPPSSALN